MESERKEVQRLDRETSDKLYKACYMQVYSYVMTLTKNKESAEEITQETFYRAITTDRAFRGESESTTWLCAIAKNIFIDETRKRKRLAGPPEESIPDTGPDFRDAVSDKESSFRIHMILHSMEDPYREVFELRVFGELSFKQIGTIFKKTENWARVTYHRAKLKILERMDVEEIKDSGKDGK